MVKLCRYLFQFLFKLVANSHHNRFLASEPAGRGFAKDLRPATADAISEGIHTLAINACLPSAGAYSIRREAGNHVRPHFWKKNCRRPHTVYSSML
jgi:hypothetical protein